MNERIRNRVSTDRLIKYGVIALATSVTAHFVSDGLEKTDRSKQNSKSIEENYLCSVEKGENIVFQKVKTGISGSITCDNGRKIEITIPEGTGIIVEDPQS